LADGTGGFGAPRTFPASLNPSEVTIGDLNGDAKPDLITSSIGINGAADDAEEGISLLLGDAAGGFVSAGFIRVGVSDMTVGDLNGDAKADLIAADPSFSRVSVLLNTSQPGAAGPTSLTFPVQDVGTQSSSRPVLITSTGDAVLHPRPATASGDFLVASDGCTARAIPSGGTCTITVRFAPTGSGTRTGTLTVPSDDPASPLTVALSGIAPPQTTITSGPTTVTKDPAPAFSFASDQPGTFECRVDQQPFADCVSPHTSAALADGDHTFQVRAIDQAGNADPTPASHSFTVDTRAPETTITTGPSGPTDDSTPTYGFAADTPATFECRVDGRPFAPCSSPYTTPELSAGDQGAHTFAVRATDVAGNTDPTPATRSIVVTAQTRLIAEPAVLRLSGLTLTIGTLTARLEDASTHAPVAGRTIAFMSVDGRPICSAVTDGAGVARCSTSRSLLQVLLGGGYLARFAGDGGRYAPSGARGELIGA
jgi:hypothetical protein